MTNYMIYDDLGLPPGTASGSASGGSFFGKIDPNTLYTLNQGLAIGGVLSSAIGAYYSVKSEQMKAESQASFLEFKQSMSQIDARNAERFAMDLFKRGQQAKALHSMKLAQEKAAIKAKQGASGVRVGVGSYAEILASEDLAKDMDMMMMDSNTLRQVQSARNQQMNIEMAGESYLLNASNMREAASQASPMMAGFSSFLGSAGQIVGAEITRQGKSNIYSEYSNA